MRNPFHSLPRPVRVFLCRGLLVLALVPFLVYTLVVGLWRWFCELCYVFWSVKAVFRNFCYTWRELGTPGIHAREQADRMMPTNWKGRS